MATQEAPPGSSVPSALLALPLLHPLLLFPGPQYKIEREKNPRTLKFWARVVGGQRFYLTDQRWAGKMAALPVNAEIHVI